jgi:predicted dehydrogenase
LKSQENQWAWPDYVAVIGGGRWARVLIEVVCSLTPMSVKISVHSPRNFSAMEGWVVARGLEDRIRVCSDYPKSIAGKRGAVIVANAARDHEKAIEWALHQGLPVLAEKPVTLSFFATQRMIDLADSQNTYLATAHVFLFASYIETFSKLVSNEKSIVSVRVLWSDPQIESRYGEAKNYDPGLPIYADWLPHIISILKTFTAGPAILSENIGFYKGGSHLIINLLYGQIPCQIEIARNHNSRQRIIEVNTENKKITLDFGSEPGVICINAKVLYDDGDWDRNPKPVSNMLSAFLKAAVGGSCDARLDCLIGLSASQLIDQTAALYRAALFPWLNGELNKHQDAISSDLRYALAEILQMNDLESIAPMEQRINYLYRHLKEIMLATNDATIKFVDDTVKIIIKKGNNTSYL